MNWQSVTGWAGFRSQYREILPCLPQAAQVVEVGSYHGRSILWMTEFLRQIGRTDISIWAVDSWSGDFSEAGPAFQANLREEIQSGWVRTLAMHSVAAAATFPEHSLDYVFIDADHSYLSVAADIQAWWPRVRPGGYMGGDDHSAGTEENGVAQAVREFSDAQGLAVRFWPNLKNGDRPSGKVKNWLVEKPI